MRALIFMIAATMLFSISAFAQTTASTTGATATASTAASKPKKAIFRANKDQIKQVQTMLKEKNLYTGEASGKLDTATRTAIKGFQKENGLNDTGTLNRATLEKMNIELTDTQKAIPVAESSFASTESKTDSKSASSGTKTKRTIFRATKDQINEAQKLLKSKGMYAGDETGKLDTPTRDGLKKFQESSGLKVTGTLNQVTLEKMGIELTDKQKQTAASNK